MKKIKTDVMIMGAGGAGARAAIAAADGGARVVVTSKDLFGKSGCTPVAMGGYAGMQAYPGDDWLLHFNDTVIGGGLMNNQRLVEILVKEARDQLFELEDWCAAFDRDEKGEIYLRQFGGHLVPRSCVSGDRTGREMMWALKRRCWGNDLIQIVDETYITKLLVNEGKIAGAMGVNLRTGNITVFECPVVILAAGGCGRNWHMTFSSKGKVGDGLRLAYEAGAELVDMEFFQIHPTGWLWPPAIRGRMVTESVRSEGGRLYNSNGERFMERYDPEKMELATRDYVSRCIYAEVKEGRGSEHGGVYLDVSHMPAEFIERRLGSVLETGLVGGIDIRKQQIEVIPEHHYQNGGVKINEYGETAVEGLYAAGEQTGGVHGGNRLGSNSLPDLLVFGRRAGEAAARYAKNAEAPEIQEHQVEEEVKSIRRPLENEKGLSPYALSKRLYDVMREEMGIARNEKALTRCLDIIEEVSEDFAEVSVSGKSLKYNDAWVTAMEVTTRILVGKIMARASLMRTESRAALYREDYPNTNRSEWDKNIMISQENGQMKLETQPVVVTILPLEEVDLPKFPMPGGQ